MAQSAKTPIHPCLQPGTELVDVDSNTILLRSFSRTIMLSGEFVQMLPDLIKQMDGRTPLEVLLSRIPEIARTEFERFL